MWNAVSHHVPNVDGNDVDWIEYGECLDEGEPTQLLCASSDAPAEDVVAAVAEALGELGCSCELWASAPAIFPLRPAGDRDGYDEKLVETAEKEDASDANSREDRHASTVREWGMFVQTSLLNGHEVRELRRCVAEEIEDAEKLIRRHRPGINIGKDVMSFREIASRGNERFDLLLPPNSGTIRDIVERSVLGRVSPVLERILNGRVGKDIDFDVSVVYSKPGAPNQGWHADGDHQRGCNDAGWEADGWRTRLAEPYALCLFVPLIDLDDETGFTQFWPGSHRSRGLMGFGAAAEIAGTTWDGKCRAGDAIWYDYRLMHRGMGNSSMMLRPVLQVLFKKSWYAEKRNYGEESIRQPMPLGGLAVPN